jgi:hypothetical protein
VSEGGYTGQQAINSGMDRDTRAGQAGRLRWVCRAIQEAEGDSGACDAGCCQR